MDDFLARLETIIFAISFFGLKTTVSGPLNLTWTLKKGRFLGFACLMLGNGRNTKIFSQMVVGFMVIYIPWP